MRPLSIWGMQYAWDNYVSEDMKRSFGDGTLNLYEERKSHERHAALHLNLKESVSEGFGGALSRRKVRKVMIKILTSKLRSMRLSRS
jgi:hypothetical protein